jgi:hypothetical protein
MSWARSSIVKQLFSDLVPKQPAAVEDHSCLVGTDVLGTSLMQQESEERGKELCKLPAVQ